MNKLIINFTPTGMIPLKSQTPYVPISCEEIIEQVKEVYKMGINMVHLHARDAKTEESVYQKEIYAKMIYGIREFAPDLIICVSTSGRVYNELEKRSDVLNLTGDLKPDMASLTLSSLNFNKSASINEPSVIIGLAKAMQEKEIRPELEVFDLGMINYAHYLIKKGLITPPYYFNIILGNIACGQANLLSAGVMLNELPKDSIPCFGGIGQYQLRINSLAVSMGYGVRVGLEDNIWFDSQRTKLATNSALVSRIRDIAIANEREIMSTKELRKLLGLKKGYGNYGIKN